MAQSRALRHAAAVSVSSMSAQLTREALELLPEDHPDRLELLADQARSLLVLGQFEQANAAATAAAGSDVHSAVALRSSTTLALATMLQHGAADLLPPLGADQLEAVDTKPDSPERLDYAIALADYSMIETLGGRPHDAARTARAAAALAPSDRVVVAGSMSIGLDAVLDGRYAEAVALADRMMTTFDESTEQIAIVGYGPWMVEAVVRSAVGDTARALAATVEGRRMTTMVEIPMLQMNFAIAELLTLFAAGRWDEHLLCSERSLAHADKYGNRMWRTWLHALDALVHIRRGSEPFAEASLRAAAETTSMIGIGTEYLAWTAATIARYAGDSHQALLRLRAAHDALHEAEVRVGPAPLFTDLIRHERWHGSTLRGAALLETVDVVDPALSAPRALFDGAAGLLTDDMVGVETAATVLEPVFPFEAARLHHDAARIAAAAGDLVVAAKQFRRADALLVALGAEGERAYLARWATRAGLIGGPGDGIAALTTSERRVAEMVQSGHSNREIARLLGASVRTVETHLRHVYRKLGVDSRLRLATSDADFRLTD